MAKKKGVITSDEWDEGTAPSSDSDKELAIIECLKKVGRGGMSTSGIEEETRIKWLYGPVKKLYEAGVLERKKVGRANFFRIATKEE